MVPWSWKHLQQEDNRTNERFVIEKKNRYLDFKTDKEFYYYFYHNENTTEIGLHVKYISYTDNAWLFIFIEKWVSN